MDRDKLLKGFTGALLAFLISLGSVQCLNTGFRLGEQLGGTAVLCAVAAAASALLLQLPRGGLILLGLGSVLTGYLWHNGELGTQFSALAYEITRLYDNGYGCGILGEPGGSTGGALSSMGCVIALLVSYVVCRGKSAAPALTAALLPLALCVVVTDTVPAEIWLLCLFFGLTLLVMTNRLRKLDPGQSIRLTWMLALPLALALALLFWLVPRQGYDKQPVELQAWILDTLADMPQSLEEFVEDAATRLEGAVQQNEVDLTDVGPMTQLEFPVMDVVAPRSGTLYLREQDYDLYDGTGWTATVRRSEEFGRNDELDWQVVGTLTIATRQSRDLAFLPYYPEDAVTLTGGRQENPPGTSAYDYTLYGLPGDWHDIATRSVQYDMGIVFTDGSLYDSGPDRRYLTLPNSSKAALEDIVDRILTDERSATQIAEAIAAYVRGSASYDLDTRRMPAGEDDFALWFLSDSDTGYCVHFATATAVLLRAAGVESRYVTGYMAQVQAGQPVTVTGAEAHAWVEYYEPRLDTWIPLESTPGDSSGPVTSEPTETWETTEAPDVTEPSSQTEPEQSHPEETEDPSSPQEQKPTRSDEIGGQWVIGVLGGLLILTALLALPIRRQLRLRKYRREQEGGPNAQALALWARSERLAQQLGQELPQPLEQLAQKARFSQHTLTEQEIAVFRDYIEETVRMCRELPWYRRVLQQYVYVLY